MRLDSTVVETDIHYPNDSSLLEDKVRVIARLLIAGEELAPIPIAIIIASSRCGSAVAYNTKCCKGIYVSVISTEALVIIMLPNERMQAAKPPRGGYWEVFLKSLGLVFACRRCAMLCGRPYTMQAA
jgi:hypothetical protein